MSGKDLEKYLEILSSERCLKKPKEAVIILEKISNCFTHESSQITLGILSSLLLDENDAIYTFIWKTSAQSETLPCVSAAFKLLDYLVTNFHKCTEPYFHILYQKCTNFFDAKFSKVKELSLKLIKNIIEGDSKHTINLSQIVSKLEKYLREETKISGTVADQIFTLFGYLFEKYPESVKNEKWLLLKMFECLKKESTAKNPSLCKIKGAFDGINGYLVNYPPPEEAIMKKTYEFILKWCKFREDKKAVSRAGLNILQNHWRHFSSFIYNDRDIWRINLDVWISEKGVDRQIAFKFLCSLYSVIALFTKQKSNSAEIKNYITEFTKSLGSKGNFYEKKAALVGIKLFILTGSLTTDDFNATYDAVMNFIKREEMYKNFTYIPLCVECISAFALKFSNEKIEHLNFLQSLSVKLIEHYPNLDQELQPNAVIALEKSFYMIGLSNLKMSEDHIDRVLYQGLIRTCSSMTLAEFELLLEVGEKSQDSVCYKSFLNLWEYLLTLANSPHLPVGGSFTIKKGVAVKVFDAFVRSFLKIILKLDFNVSSAMEIEKPSDLHIFINIVDLYQDLMPLIDIFNLEKWLIELFKKVISLSYKNPLLSGFYKIMVANLKVADRIHFFEECTPAKEKCFELVRKYLEDTLAKVDHYKGDLQVACLNVLLASPVKVIEGLVEKAVSALEVITQLARNSFPLLKDLIETLERWDLYLPSATSDVILRKILPLLDVFFQSPYFRGKNSVDSSKGGKKLKVEVVFNDSELLELQKKFLMFLGNLEIQKGLNLIELSDTEDKRDINDKHLVYSLPCGNRWVELNLDEMILRVVGLAESCGDRKTRVTACELLHSMVLVIMGNVNQMSGGYGFLFRKVTKACLSLGCDSDGLVCQIFEPLMYQMVHYFSGKQGLNLTEANDLIDILVDGVTCPYNPNVREFSGELLREFTVWSIKQLSPEELKTTPESVKRILQKIYSLALHPSYNKRLGAAVIFNKIYSVLREEEFILNSYWFQLFYYFLESLRMCDGQEDVAEITEAIRHLERPLVEKSKEFNTESPERIVPPEFKGGRLCHLVKWTMERACDVQPTTRHTAMGVVQKLAPLVENCESNMIFSSKHLQNFLGLKETSQTNFEEENFTESLRYHCAGFEYCSWLLQQDVITTEEVFQSKFKAILKHFINGIMSQTQSSPTANEHKQQAVIAFLTLLYDLKERAYLYPPEHWELLKMAIFKPSKFGFDLNQSSNTERLFSALLNVLQYFSSHLTEYDWNHFYKRLETVVTLPVFLNITKNKCVTVENLEFLFAIKVIERSGIWKVFVEKIFYSMNPDLLIDPIFKCLFFKRGKTEYAVALEPSCKSYLEEILKILLKGRTDLHGVMKLLENEEEVREEETEKPIKKGDFFQSLFKTQIFGFLASKPNLLIDWALMKEKENGVKFLIRVLENEAQDSDLPVEIFMRWHEFEQIGNIPQTEKLILLLALSGARVFESVGFLKTSPIAEKIYSILENRKLEDLEYSEIETIFGLFPFLSVFGESKNDNEDLRKCLSKIQVNAVKEVEDSVKSGHVQTALNGILQSLKSTASLVILDFVASKAGCFNEIFKKGEVESALTVFGDVRTPVEHSVAALQLLYGYCFKQKSKEVADIADAAIVYKLLLGPLLNLTPILAVYQFFEKNIENLHNLTIRYWEDTASLIEILTNIRQKICAAKMFQAFITKLSKEELDQMPKECRQMIVATVKNVFFFLKKPYPPKVLKDRYRKLMCEIFNMICCIVSARCTDEKFYKLFIFDDRGSFLFEAIDKNSTYNLDMDFEEIPKRKKHLTILRESIAGETILNFGSDSVKYVQTNTLFTSSLRQEVTRFDLTSSFIRPINSIPETKKNVEIELEMDSLNSHECMATLVATISKMVQDKITPVDDVTELPCWLRFFLSVLRNSEVCENLKLFVLKAIYNVQEFVAAFCKQIFSDLLDSILKLFINYPINYFLVDLIEMMVSWRHLPGEEKTRIQLTELVEIVLQKSDSLRRDIVKYNLEILKIMIEVWKNGMHLPQLSSTVFKRLSKSVEEDLRMKTNNDSVTYLNIHACGILLSNGIPIWEVGSERSFFELISKGFRDENKHNQLFGEICGQALNHLQQTKPNSVGDYEELVSVKINNSGCWLQLLYGVHKHHPKISSRFTLRIFQSAWDSMDSLTVQKLEMLLSHVSATESTEDSNFDRHASMFIIDMLNSPNADVQEYSLRIAEKLLHKLDKEKLKIVMKDVVRLQGSVHSGVRKWVYEIGKKLYRKGPDDVFPECRVILLRGLNDGVKELEESCVEFWRKVLNAVSPQLALPQMLSDMYSPDTEDIFLSNVIRVLLHLAKDDHNSMKELFPHPITNHCRFKKRNLVLGARQSFLMSLASSARTMTNRSLENVATIRHQKFPYLRPTANTLNFQPTAVDNEKEIVVPIPDPPKKTLLPTNPFKRRFYKSEAKTAFSFARRKINKKQDIQKTDPQLDIYGEYRDGNYPDIQIKHSQISKLLQILSRRDQQFARIFLVSFYSGLVKSASTEEKEILLSKTNKHFEDILQSSGNFDPGLFGFLLQVILNHGQNLDVDYQLVSNAAVSSNWISLGALIIEQVIANKEGEEEVSAKRRKGCESPEERRWLELARLYRSLEEFDVVSGIFLDKLDVLGDAKDAIRCESVRDWAGASKHYELALRSDPDVSQVEFYTESYLSCLAKLSNWSLLNNCIRSTVNNDLGELWNNYYLLSWFLKSEMMISLGNDRKEFHTILQEFCTNPVKRDILAANFGEEMMVLDWFSDNLQRANYRIDKLCLDFLAGWSHLDRWSYNLRAAKLTSLQTISELSFAVKNLAETSKSQLEQNIELGVKRWEKNIPSPRNELTVWDVKLAYRREFLKRLNDFDLTVLDVKANLALAKAALSQTNLSLTKECLNRAKEKIPEGNFDLKAEHNICFNMGKMVIAKQKMKDPNVGLNVYLNVWNGISKQISSGMETDSDSSKTLAYSCNFTLGQLVSEIFPFVKKQTAPPEILNSLCKKFNSSKGDLPTVLQDKGLLYFETAIAALENANGSSDAKSNAYLELSKFFLKFPEPGRFEKLSEYLLKSMALGNPEARQLFGCLLNASLLPADEAPLQDIPECDRVPSWMFLGWINQMLASLNSKFFPFLKPLLLRITQDYPNAIRYPLKLAEEGKSQEPKTKTLLTRLSGIVRTHRVYDDFWNAIKYLAPPDLILTHYLEEALEEADLSNPDYAQIKKIILNLKQLMFSNDYEKFRGPVFKFWDTFQDPIEDLLTGLKDGEVLKRKIKNILSSLQQSKMPSRRVLGLLESYSPWLYNFQTLKTDAVLELPGQYDGDREPIKKHLVTVSSFRNSVLMFDSKCRPIRITILGNDAKEHRFLVKFGEDTRQDERIQQVFRHFGNRLQECIQTRSFYLDTYKVVPLTSNLGLIEWVDDCASLYEMVVTRLGNDSEAIVDAQRDHLAFLSQGSPLAVPGSIGGTVAAHLIAYEMIKRENAISNFWAIAHRFPKDLLKKSFLDLSTSPEHFLYLRGNFATSHAITCVTHWLVGIGDRHLQNILVSTKTGRVLGIDFGYAFGFATQFLSPPELMPFRLSPQILNVMHPLGESGWIKQTMIHCLRLFRKDCFRLRAVLQVFAEEPVMNWLKQVKKNPTFQIGNDTWYPTEKLSLVERKLSGVNPVVAVEADLRAGHSQSKYLEKYLEVLKGFQQDNIRARCAEDGLTEEEQVECLIDLATDPHVLAKTYIGWNPWL